MKALATLCSLKKVVEFTDDQLDKWSRTLMRFPPDVVDIAVVKEGLGEDPFPQLGTLVRRCRELQSETSTEYSPHRDYGKLPTGLAAEIARDLGLGGVR